MCLSHSLVGEKALPVTNAAPPFPHDAAGTKRVRFLLFRARARSRGFLPRIVRQCAGQRQRACKFDARARASKCCINPRCSSRSTGSSSSIEAMCAHLWLTDETARERKRRDSGRSRTQYRLRVSWIHVGHPNIHTGKACRLRISLSLL